jgi:hypothetical protein
MRNGLALLVLFLAAPAAAEVEGFCTLCHKYPGLGRLEKLEGNDQESVPRVFYINNELFEASYHGKIRCKSCHTGVDKFPHADTKPVDCAADCHIADPSVNRPFSHKKIVDDYRNSVHGVSGSRASDKSDLPVCKDCHRNKPYHASIEEREGAKVFLSVCLECHDSKPFAERFYEHMIYRTTKRRPSKEVVRLCSTCHADKALMDKHDLDVVIGFSSTFHAKAISFGDEEVANCLNCHAPYELGFSPHRITSARDSASPVSEENKIKTCRQSDCHVGAQEKFAAGGRVHPSRRAQELLIPSVTQKGWQTMVGGTDFETTVLGLIRAFYMVLIACVIGGLGAHWLLVLYASRRQHMLGRH